MTDRQREEGRTGDDGEINGYTPLIPTGQDKKSVKNNMNMHNSQVFTSPINE